MGRDGFGHPGRNDMDVALYRIGPGRRPRPHRPAPSSVARFEVYGSVNGDAEKAS
jgi:hypothetical protein